MPEWHCDPGVSIAGLTARSKWYKSEFVPFQQGGSVSRNGGSVCSGMGGQDGPESTFKTGEILPGPQGRDYHFFTD